MTVDDTALRDALGSAPVVPVLTVAAVTHAAPLAEALARGGLKVVEVTLRTEEALDAIPAMKAAAPDLIVGAGTVLSPKDVDSAVDAGADFLVSPGATNAVAEAMADRGVPAFPGVATASEAMARAEDGFSLLKLFPASAAGGLSLLKALGAPLPHLSFMPTGGITPETAPDYLALPNVIAVGGSWLATGEDLARGDWAGIEAKAAAAAALRKG